MAGTKGRSGRHPGDTATPWADALRVALSRVDVDGRKKPARLADSLGRRRRPFGPQTVTTLISRQKM
jgi:hypothetical protein